MIKHILKYGLFTACLSWILVSVSSCQGDDGSGGAPEITGVRITNPASADSIFAQANTGQMIAVIGKNLANVQKAYINDQSISFNPTYNTATSIILTIPTERNMTTGEDTFTLLYTEDGGVLSIKPGTIKLETKYGTATYAFTVLGGNPSITLVDADEYPTPTGGKVTVTGDNFVNIQRVYFTNVSPDSLSQQGGAQIVEVSGWTVSSNRYLDPVSGYVVKSALTFTLPDLPRDADGNYFGYMVIEGPKSGNQTQGARTSTKFATLPSPVVESITSDMPMVGQTVTITGKYFIGVQSIDIKSGDNTFFRIPAASLTITKTTISFIMPAKPTNPDFSPLSIVALAGTTTLSHFYPVNNVLLDFDTKGRDQQWGPSATYQEADGVNPPYNSDGKFALMSGKGMNNAWWGIMIYWAAHKDEATGNALDTPFDFPSYDVIPANTPADQVYLSYDCYNTVPFNVPENGGFIRYFFNTTLGGGPGGTINWGDGDYQWLVGPNSIVLPGIDGQPLMNQWYQVLIPMSRFAGLNDGKATYKNIVESGLKEFVLQIQFNGNPIVDVNLSIDNIRIVTKLKSVQ